MTAYDVQVTSPSGRSGDTFRVEAEDHDAAGEAALALAPEGWTVARVSDATDHGPAWGVDATSLEVPDGPLIGTGSPVDAEPYVIPEPDPDEPEAA